MKKLLLFGPDSIHLVNYLQLIEGYFDEILVISDGLNKDIKFNNHRVISFSIRNPIQNFFKIQEIKKLIHEFKPDIIHLHNIGTGAYLLEKATRNLKIPKIATAWGSDVLVAPQKNIIFKKIVTNVLNNFDFFTSDANFMAYEMNKLVSKELQIEIANFGINQTERITISTKQNIIYSNRLHNELYQIDKIIDLFIDFMNSSSSKDWKLVIAATGKKTELLKEKVNHSKYRDQIEFVGWVTPKDNSYWYSKSKIYISIPKSDGTSISLLEAMDSGCIPIVSNLPANNEWIKDSFNGIVYLNNSENPISKALALDVEKVVDRNQSIIAIHGLKQSNRDKFISIYTKAKLS